MKAQEIFDHVARHLLTQMAPARKNGNCVYRTSGGRSCAVGCLLTDEEAKAADALNANGSDVWLLEDAGLLPKRIKRSARLLSELQDIHDNEPTYMWRAQLLELARERGLSAKAIKVFERERE